MSLSESFGCTQSEDVVWVPRSYEIDVTVRQEKSGTFRVKVNARQVIRKEGDNHG